MTGQKGREILVKPSQSTAPIYLFPESVSVIFAWHDYPIRIYSNILYMQAWEIAVLAFYGMALLFIFGYSLVQLHLIILYRNARKRPLPTPERQEEWPAVTVQLPLFNELYVAERLIDRICELDYPQELLEIQVLDDSTDETVEIVAQKVEEWRTRGMDIRQVRRPKREGFKAGALQYGMKRATGEFLAIFDADFLPDRDFLRKTIPYFQDSNIGVVQTCWGHLNEDYSLLTKMKAFGLNAHFSVEQSGRNYGDHFLNFNGTAGVWRKSCIEEAGGWQSDTITEDLDLSYRAQLKGWKIRYLEDIVSPAELPATMNAFKSQQFRWTKGAAETFRKHFLSVIRAKLSFPTKIHALFHLMNSALFLCIVCCSMLSVPTLLIKSHTPELAWLFHASSFFALSVVILMIFYWHSMRKAFASGNDTTRAFVPRFFLFLSLSMGLSLHNAVAVLDGYIGRKTPFVRTPKFNIQNKQDQWSNTKYLVRGLKGISPITLLEGIMAIYFGWGIYLGIALEDVGLLPFHTMLFIGFSTVCFYSVRHAN